MTWWPIQQSERDGRTCDECPATEGLSRDDHGHIYCPAHRHLHRD